MGGHEYHAQSAGGLHHHEVAAAAEFGDALGVAGEGDSGEVHRILVHRGGYDRGDFAGDRILCGEGQRVIGEFAAAGGGLADFQLGERERPG